MNAMIRTAVAAGLASVAGVSAASAQIPGMPLFTNPNFGTGFRIHADLGQPTSEGTSIGDVTVIQGGVTFALWRLGLGANVGMLKSQLDSVTGCTGTGAGCDPNTRVTGSALAQIKLAGGGRQSLSLSVFAGLSTDFNAGDVATLPASVPQIMRDSIEIKRLTIPIGVAVGMKAGPVNVWGAPRYNMTRYSTCPASQVSRWCDDNKGGFRWAVGADLPILGILAIRAAFDSGKDQYSNETLSVWGIGASIGLGGVH